MKKIIFLILILSSLFFLPACGKKDVNINDDYIALSCLSIDDGVTMGVEFGFCGERWKEYSRSDEVIFKERLKANMENLRNEFLITLALKYTQNPIKEFAINRGVVLSQVIIEDECARFSIRYTSIPAWNYYNSQGGEKEKQEGFYLIKKVQSEGEFPFSATLSNGITMATKYKNIYLSSLEGLSIEERESRAYCPQFIYDYRATASRLKSNADIVTSGSINRHIWVKEESDLKNSEILIWQYQVNYPFWYLFAILLTIIPCAVYVTFQLIKERKMFREQRNKEKLKD